MTVTSYGKAKIIVVLAVILVPYFPSVHCSEQLGVNNREIYFAASSSAAENGVVTVLVQCVQVIAGEEVLQESASCVCLRVVPCGGS